MDLNKVYLVPEVKNRKYRIPDLIVTHGHEVHHNEIHQK